MTTYQQRRIILQETLKKFDDSVINLIAKIPKEIFAEETNKKTLYTKSKLKYKGAWDIPDLEFTAEIILRVQELKQRQRLLIVGSGTGYLISILSAMFDECYGVEIQKDRFDQCMENLNTLKIHNAVVKNSDGYEGWDLGDKYDCIIIMCGIPAIPKPIIEQTADNGTIFAPIGPINLWPEENHQDFAIFNNKGQEIQSEKRIEVFVTPMVGKINNS